MSVPRTVEPSGIADDSSNPHPVVCGDAAPNEPQIEMRWLREKPTQVSKTTLVTKKITHGQPLCGNIGWLTFFEALSVREGVSRGSALMWVYMGWYGSSLHLCSPASSSGSHRA